MEVHIINDKKGTVRKVEVEPGEIITLAPNERVVFPWPLPDWIRIQEQTAAGLGC